MGRSPLDHMKEFFDQEPIEPVQEVGNNFTTEGKNQIENTKAKQYETYYWVPYPVTADEDGEIQAIAGVDEKREVTVKYNSGRSQTYKVKDEYSAINVTQGKKIKKNQTILKNYTLIKVRDYHVLYY